MAKNKNNEHLQDLEWFDAFDPFAELDEMQGDAIPRIRNGAEPRRKAGKPREVQHEPKKEVGQVIGELSDGKEELEFSYKAKLHEAKWIHESLDELYYMGWLDDVLRVVKGGKEASVYQCKGNETTGEEFIAAKIYRPRMFRNLRNDHMYRVGRAHLDSDGVQITDDGQLRAIDAKSGYGKSLMHQSWIEYEYQTLLQLYEAGADVPKPFARGNNVILMQYLGGAVLPAPTLNEVDLEPEEVQPLFDRCLHNLELMLAHDRIHGDYSAYNILYWEGEITVIDFPQVVSPHENPSAYMIFARDVQRICDYFKGQGVEANAGQIADTLWAKYGHRLKPRLDIGELDDENPDDRAFYEKYKE